MRYTLPAFIAGLLVTLPLTAGEDGLTGHWKFSINARGMQTWWLVHLDSKDGKITGTLDVLKGAPKAKLENIKTDGDRLTMKIKAAFVFQGKLEEVVFDYEGRLPKPGAKKIFGSVSEDGSTMLAIMESTSAKNVFELDRETVVRTPTDPRAFQAIIDVIEQAKQNDVDGKDLHQWVENSLKAAEAYGPKVLVKHQLDILKSLQRQKPYAEVTLETGRKVLKSVDAKLPVDLQLQLFTSVSSAVRSAGKASEADALDSKLDKIENTAYEEHAKNALNFKLEKYAGRKNKGDRAVLVELFTGAQCPPCVAADMAFDGLDKTYGPGEVVLLQYHMHIPGPDPMSNNDNDARFEQYLQAYPNKVRGTPSVLFNGKLDAPGGGSRESAPEKYKEYVEVVNRRLEDGGDVKLSASAVRTGEKIAINAKVQNVDKPGEKVRLRLALVEDWVRYKGSNGLQYHHRIVRALPGGAKGVAVTEKSMDHKANVDLADLRTALHKYLDEDYTDGPRPMRLRNLSVVAFVQNDVTLEVLQAVNVAVKGE